MKDQVEFWIEDDNRSELGFVYRLEKVEDGIRVYLLKGGFIRMNQEQYVGKVEKINRRGVTFKSYSIDTAGTNVFVGRGSFTVMTADEYAQHR